MWSPRKGGHQPSVPSALSPTVGTYSVVSGPAFGLSSTYSCKPVWPGSSPSPSRQSLAPLFLAQSLFIKHLLDAWVLKLAGTCSHYETVKLLAA